MLDAAVDQVRSFNRLVTQRVGALDDHYLARDRPLGEARLLWEIGAAGCDVRRAAGPARPRLGLPQPPAPLPRGRRARQVVDRRRRPARPHGAAHPGRPRRAGAARAAQRRARSLAPRAAERGAARAPRGRDGRGRAAPDRRAGRDRAWSTRPTRRPVLPARVLRRARPALRDRLRPRVEHLRRARRASGRLPALSSSRRCGRSPSAAARSSFQRTGRPISSACGSPSRCAASDRPPASRRARAARGGGGARVVTLETNRALTEAIALYRSAGYREVDPFNDEPYAHHWFEKQLAPRGAG